MIAICIRKLHVQVPSSSCRICVDCSQPVSSANPNCRVPTEMSTNPRLTWHMWHMWHMHGPRFDLLCIYLNAISHVILCNIWVFWITSGHMFWNPRAALPGLSLWAVPLLIFVPGQSLAAQRTSDCVMITVTT